MTDWKSSFKKDIQVKLAHADVEYKKYRRETELIYLQQACEKLFSAVENFLMLKYRRAKNYNDLLMLVYKNEKDSALLTTAAKLHYFFYNGDIEIPAKDADKLYNSVRDRLKARLSS